MMLLEVLAVAAISTVVATARVFRPLRERTTKGTYLGDLLRCGFCQSFWWSVPVVLYKHGIYLETILWWLAVSFLAGIIWLVTAYMFSRME